MGVVYVAGLPAGVFLMLYHRRHVLFGNASDTKIATTQSAYGFLYLSYGADAWWWEVEELLRKLLLSAVVVLVEAGSPVQVSGLCLLVRRALGLQRASACRLLGALPGDSRGDGFGMGPCPPRHLQTLGCGQRDVRTTARQPVCHVLRIPLGTCSSLVRSGNTGSVMVCFYFCVLCVVGLLAGLVVQGQGRRSILTGICNSLDRHDCTCDGIHRRVECRSCMEYCHELSQHSWSTRSSSNKCHRRLWWIACE